MRHAQTRSRHAVFLNDFKNPRGGLYPLKRDQRSITLKQKTRSLFSISRTASAVFLAVCVLFFAGCKDDQATASETLEVSDAMVVSDTIEASERDGILQTSMGTYKFTPGVCAIHLEDGFYDIEVQGPGTAPDGEVFFFELSSTAAEISISLGVDTAFAHSERTLNAGQYHSRPFSIQVSGSIITVSDLVITDEDGAEIEGPTTLEINCATR